MSRRSSRMRGMRALALLVVVGGLQLTAVEGIAPAAETAASDDPAAPTAAAPAPDPAQATASAAPATSAPAPAAAPQPAPAPTSVTISRAGASAFRSVSIVDFAYDPTALTVKVGDTVQWINSGTAEEGHNVIGDGLESPVLHTGESYSFTFSEAGSFSYICTIHPKMTGTVEVIDPTADKPKKHKTSAKSGGRKSSSRAKGNDDTATGATSASGSESAAVSSPRAAGTSGSLPATGSRSVELALAGLALLSIGLALRHASAGRQPRRG